MRDRPDIRDAADAVQFFPAQWWGLVVFTCFGVTLGARTAAPHFQHPLPPPEAEAVLETIDFPRGSIGSHRIQPAHKGAKQALVAACADHELFNDVLHSGQDFDTRYRRLREARMRQWGRTTSFDLLLRAGTLGIGGSYTPDFAYLGGSTGPKKGFALVWGVEPNTDHHAGSPSRRADSADSPTQARRQRDGYAQPSFVRRRLETPTRNRSTSRLCFLA